MKIGPSFNYFDTRIHTNKNSFIFVAEAHRIKFLEFSFTKDGYDIDVLPESLGNPEELCLHNIY